MRCASQQCEWHVNDAVHAGRCCLGRDEPGCSLFRTRLLYFWLHLLWWHSQQAMWLGEWEACCRAQAVVCAVLLRTMCMTA